MCSPRFGSLPHRPRPRTVKRASIKDIARLANVSHSTVSRALSCSQVVNAETAERIRRIAREAGYCPSAAARSLVTSRTRTVGVVVTDIADPFAAEVVRGIEDAAAEHDYSIFLANSNADPDREMKVVRCFEERRVDGIIVTSSRVGIGLCRLALAHRCPHRAAQQSAPEQLSVFSDDREYRSEQCGDPTPDPARPQTNRVHRRPVRPAVRYRAVRRLSRGSRQCGRRVPARVRGPRGRQSKRREKRRCSSFSTFVTGRQQCSVITI